MDSRGRRVGAGPDGTRPMSSSNTRNGTSDGTIYHFHSWYIFINLSSISSGHDQACRLVGRSDGSYRLLSSGLKFRRCISGIILEMHLLVLKLDCFCWVWRCEKTWDFWSGNLLYTVHKNMRLFFFWLSSSTKVVSCLNRDLYTLWDPSVLSTGSASASRRDGSSSIGSASSRPSSTSFLACTRVQYMLAWHAKHASRF